MRRSDSSVSRAEQTWRESLDAIGSKAPIPGGGAVAAMTAALGAALGQMVVRYSKGKKTLATFDAEHDRALAVFSNAVTRADVLAEADARAFEALSALWKLPEDDPRQAELEPAVRAAIDAPLGVLKLCESLATQAEGLCGRSNRMLASDLAIVAILAEAAARAAAWNVRINLPSLPDADERARLNTDVTGRVEKIRTACEGVERACTAD